MPRDGNLLLAHRPAGEAVRALAWLGPEEAESALRVLKEKPPSAAFGELVAARRSFRPGSHAAWEGRVWLRLICSFSRGIDKKPLRVAADRSGRPVHLLEKDVWVVSALETLFRSSIGEHL